MAPDWNTLSHRFARAQAEAVERRRELETRAGAHLDEWCTWAENRAMEAVVDAASRRSAEIAVAGPRIVVRYPSPAPAELEAVTPQTHFASFCLGWSRVQVYSARSDGGWPHLHLVSAPLRTGRRYARLVSLPGCRVVPDDHLGYALLDLSDTQAPPQRTTADSFVYRAFDLLAGEAFRAARGNDIGRVSW